MSKIKKIDINRQVMDRIKEDDIKMRSTAHFKLMKVGNFLLLGLLAVILVAVVASVVYVIKNDTFSEYFDFNNGRMLFIKSLPWPGIILGSIAFGGLLFMMNKVRKTYDRNFSLSMVYASLAILLLPAIAIGMSTNTSNTPKILSSLAYFSNNDPVRLELTVKEFKDGYLYALDGDGNLKILKNVENQDSLKEGDKLLVIGTEKGGVVYVKVYKVTDESEDKKDVADAPKQETKPPETKPEDKPKTTTPTTTTETPAPTPTPAPTKTITITSVIPYPGSVNPSKYKVYWTANFTLPNGFKLPCSLSPNPVYPGSYCTFNGTPASSGVGIVEKTMFGAGTYYVKVCEYTGSGCSTYSSQITVTFPS